MVAGAGIVPRAGGNAANPSDQEGARTLSGRRGNEGVAFVAGARRAALRRRAGIGAGRERLLKEIGFPGGRAMRADSRGARPPFSYTFVSWATARLFTSKWWYNGGITWGEENPD